MDFTQVLGHKSTIENLQNAIKKGQVSHSYLFEGEESIGKRMVALSFAKTLLCKKQGLQPCNNCNSCLKFDNFNHPDFELIEPEKDKIKRDEIKNIIDNINIAPLESPRRIFIIDNSDKIGVEGQNALLKTLEEPPSYINIILITSNINKLIPTILSRCERIKFYPVETKKIGEFLVSKYDKTIEEASFISHFTKGSVGRAITLSETPEFFEMREEVLNIIDSIIKGDKFKAFSSMDFFLNNKEDYEEILDIIIYWFRDLILYKELGNTELLVNKDKTSLLSSQSFLKEGQINDIINRIMDTKKDIRGNVNYQLAMETMLLSMQEV